MNEVEKLFEYLKERKLTLGGLTPGNKATTPEDMAKAIRESLGAIERGEYEEIAGDDFDVH
jgi:hypothetical protein